MTYLLIVLLYLLVLVGVAAFGSLVDDAIGSKKGLGVLSALLAIALGSAVVLSSGVWEFLRNACVNLAVVGMGYYLASHRVRELPSSILSGIERVVSWARALFVKK